MKLKSLILTIGISLFALSGLLAQDKYEFATLKDDVATINFTTSSQQEVTKVAVAKQHEINLLKKLEELNEKGWEVYNSLHTSTGYAEIYFLRKKKTQ